MTAATSLALVAYGCSDSTDAPAPGPGNDAAPAADATTDVTTPVQDSAPTPPLSDGGTDADEGDNPALIVTSQPFVDGGPIAFAGFFPADGGGATAVVTVIWDTADGDYALTMHQYGDCGTDGTAAAAGPHWDVGGNQHALPNEGVHHLGDLGNVTIAGGVGSLSVTDPRWTLDLTPTDGGLSPVGHAFVVHALPDQGVALQPAGGSGARLSCGVVAAP